MNAIGVIVPYKYEGMWVFDDPAVGLSREPFIAGIDTMIGRLVASIPNAEQVFDCCFPLRRFQDTTSNWNGDVRKQAAIGISALSSVSRVGYAQRCLSISTKLRWSCTLAQRRGHEKYAV